MIRISEYCHALLGSGFDSNIYIFHLDGRYLICDIGTGQHHHTVSQTLQKLGCPKDGVVGLVITHTHADHCGGITNFLKDFPCPVYVHKEEANILEQGKVKNIFGMLKDPVAPLEVNTLSEKDTITLSDLKFTVLHTPGHSQGSMCLYEPEAKILVSGDTVFSGGSFGRTDLPGGNSSELVSSLAKLAKLDVEKMLPGHMDFVLSNGTSAIQSSLRNASSVFGQFNHV